MAIMAGSVEERSRRRSRVQRVATASLLAAVAVAAAKLLVGASSGSLGVLSEGFHSSLDAGATALTLFAVRLAAKPPDREHPFGHGRAENLAALTEAALLVLLGGAVAYEAVHRLLAGIAVQPPWYAVAVMVGSMVVDAGRARALRRAARRYHSPALQADALNFTADLFGSAAVLAGLLGAWAGLGFADSVAALVVVVLIWALGGRLAAGAVDVLMDRAPSGLDERLRAAARSVPGVVAVDSIRSRRSGSATLAEVAVQVARTRSVEDSHKIATAVSGALDDVVPGISAVVSVNPSRAGGDVVERAFAAANRIGMADQVHNVTAIRHPEGLWLMLHAKVAADTHLSTAHEVANQLEGELRREIGSLARVEVHLEPRESQELEGRVVTTTEEELVRAARRIAESHPPIARCHEVAVSRVNSRLFVVLHCEASADRTVEEIHAASLRIEDELHRRFADVEVVTVHFEPE